LNVGDAPDVSGPFMTGAASAAVPVRTLLEWTSTIRCRTSRADNPAAARVSGAPRRGDPAVEHPAIGAGGIVECGRMDRMPPV